MSGRKLPLVPRVEISIIEEEQPRLLAFRSGNLDYVDVPSSLATTVLDAAYAPWILDRYTVQNQLVQPWVKGLKLHPFLRDRYMYLDVAR